MIGLFVDYNINLAHLLTDMGSEHPLAFLPPTHMVISLLYHYCSNKEVAVLDFENNCHLHLYYSRCNARGVA